MDEPVLRQKVERFFEYAGADVDRAEELYHETPYWSFHRAVSASRVATDSPSGAASTQSSEPKCATGSAG
jgi:hypothetical protein